MTFSQKVYQIIVQTMDLTYEIEKRYSEFHAFYQTVQRKNIPIYFLFKNCLDYAELPQNRFARIPKKTIFSQFKRKMSGRKEEKIGRYVEKKDICSFFL